MNFSIETDHNGTLYATLSEEEYSSRRILLAEHRNKIALLYEALSELKNIESIVLRELSTEGWGT